MNSNVISLAETAVSRAGPVHMVLRYLKDSGILPEFSEDDLELETAAPDEVLLGDLRPDERDAFVAGTLLAQIIEDTQATAEADKYSFLAGKMKDEKIDIYTAANLHGSSFKLPQDTLDMLSVCSLANYNLMTFYEFSVRSRFETWTGYLIVRNGMQVYTYG